MKKTEKMKVKKTKEIEVEEIRAAEKIIDDPFRSPPLTVSAALPVSRADRKMAPIMKASETEKAPKLSKRGGGGKGDREGAETEYEGW